MIYKRVEELEDTGPECESDSDSSIVMLDASELFVSGVVTTHQKIYRVMVVTVTFTRGTWYTGN